MNWKDSSQKKKHIANKHTIIYKGNANQKNTEMLSHPYQNSSHQENTQQ
jgi:hypothetical protein